MKRNPEPESTDLSVEDRRLLLKRYEHEALCQQRLKDLNLLAGLRAGAALRQRARR